MGENCFFFLTLQFRKILKDTESLLCKRDFFMYAFFVCMSLFQLLFYMTCKLQIQPLMLRTNYCPGSVLDAYSLSLNPYFLATHYTYTCFITREKEFWIY